MLIADDVGVGKTIEALLVTRELYDRGEIRRLCVLCPPYLCEQWQKELSEKFNIEAVVIRSGTVNQLERRKAGTESIYQHYPVQVASIDFLKSDRNKHLFLLDCPDLVIVDEAHDPADCHTAQWHRKRLPLVAGAAQVPVRLLGYIHPHGAPAYRVSPAFCPAHPPGHRTQLGRRALLPEA